MNDQENIWKNEIYRTGAEEYDYLNSLELTQVLFTANNRNDHAHCELCWNKISENALDMHAGYVDADGVYWICSDCYHDFKDLFHWKQSKTGMKGKVNGNLLDLSRGEK